jgi:two-component system, LytTR family, sensor kinase
LLIILLVKLGVATAVGSVLGRTKEFKKLLFKQNRSLRESAYLVFFIGIPFALGVYIRCAVHWVPADLGFEVSILMGMVGGRFAGCLG